MSFWRPCQVFRYGMRLTVLRETTDREWMDAVLSHALTRPPVKTVRDRILDCGHEITMQHEVDLSKIAYLLNMLFSSSYRSLCLNGFSRANLMTDH